MQNQRVSGILTSRPNSSLANLQ